jgi:hypothetical protein
MKKLYRLPVMAVALSLTVATGAFAAATGVLNPTPNRESKLIADFENTTDVTSDPNGAGENHASTDTDPQFAAEGTHSLKIDMTGVAGGWHDHEFTINFAQPIDVKGYQVLSMDVFVPDTSLADPTSYYQFDPRTTTADPTDATKTVVSYYGPRNLHTGWNHPVWNLQNGTDTTLSQLDFSGNSGADYSGPFYVDNIRLYKGNFAGLQPDEKLIFGFDKATDKDLFTVTDANGVSVNTDKQFITQGDGSLAIDLNTQGGGWTNNVATVDDWGTTVDASNATALHLDVFIPTASAPANGNWHEIGYTVTGDGGEVGGKIGSNGIVDGQWNTLEIPLTPDDAAMLKNVKGIRFIRNQGDAWQGPVYVDDLRAVVPTTPTAGGTTGQ